MVISQEQDEIRAALTLQTKCELKRVVLRHCHVSHDGSEETSSPPFSLRISTNSIANAIGDDGALRIEVRFHVQSYDSAAPPVLLFSIECAFEVEYELAEGFHPTPDSVDAFKDGNAIFNCWPYAREFVQNVTSRMEMNPPALPLLRMIPKPKQANDVMVKAKRIPVKASPRLAAPSSDALTEP